MAEWLKAAVLKENARQVNRISGTLLFAVPLVALFTLVSGVVFGLLPGPVQPPQPNDAAVNIFQLVIVMLVPMITVFLVTADWTKPVSEARRLVPPAVAVALAAAGLFVYRMGHHDAQALLEFAASYKQFDRSISELTAPALATPQDDVFGTDDAQRKADEALADLHAKASMKISSLTKNDGTTMRIARELADVAAREVTALKEYRAAQRTNQSPGTLASRLAELQRERKSTYARFARLESAPPNDPGY